MQSLPGIFEYTPFTRQGPRMPLARPAPIHAMHPKTEIRPDAAAITKILAAGWIGQVKINGHRAQIHVPAEAKTPVFIYNRQGKPHKLKLDPKIEAELRRIYKPARGWNVLDAEWLKPEKKIFVFDFLRKDDKMLAALTYPERWKLLPRHFISPYISTLPLLESLQECQDTLASTDEHVEGLVFKSRTTPGFEDTSIIRCRRR